MLHVYHISSLKPGFIQLFLAKTCMPDWNDPLGPIGHKCRRMLNLNGVASYAAIFDMPIKLSENGHMYTFINGPQMSSSM